MARVSITTSNRAPLVQILTWLFFLTGFFFFVVRQVTRHVFSGPFKLEDALITVATITGFAQSIAISAASANGLGKPLNELSQRQLNTVLKSEYAATVLLITCLGITKLSVAVFTKSVSPDVTHHRLSNSLGIAILVWTVIAVIIALFPCSPPMVWDTVHGSQCINFRAWWTFVATGNMLTDIALPALQGYTIWNVQLPRRSKALLFFIFSLRLTVVVAAIAQIKVYYSVYGDPDLTLRAWLPVVLNEVVQALGIITACIPHVKQFLDSLESGMIRVEEPIPAGSVLEGSELERLNRKQDGSGRSSSRYTK